MKEILVIYYDQECPFCDAYVHYIQLKEKYTLVLKTARDAQAELALLCPHMNINNGFIIVYQDKCFQGVDGLMLLNKLIDNKGIVRLLHKIFQSNSIITKTLYGIVLVVRKILLYAMGIKTKI